jgi:carbamate kinase
MPKKGRLAVVAVGGNSLILDPSKQSIPDQYFAATITVGHIVDMIEDGWDIVLTHGNGPQVGFILRRSEIAIGELHPVPMDYAGADIQGAVGYMFQTAFRNEFRKRGLDRKAITVVTEVLVDGDDPAFTSPTKPIGSYMDEGKAKKLAGQWGWVVKEDAGRGWRRVVPSPLPRQIIDLDAIRAMLKEGFIVIACGGGKGRPQL